MQKRILIIDDEENMLHMLKTLLSKEGYDIETASNGREALDVVREVSPDLIILDIVMPDMDGIEVKSRLNESTSTASIPVMFLTGKDSVNDKIKGLHLGIDDYITSG